MNNPKDGTVELDFSFLFTIENVFSSKEKDSFTVLLFPMNST